MKTARLLAMALAAVMFASCAREYTVTVAVSDGGGGTATASVAGGASAETLKASPGDTVTLTAVPDAHFVFNTWMTIGSGDAVEGTNVDPGDPEPDTEPNISTFVMPRGDIEFVAVFADLRSDYYGTWRMEDGSKTVTISSDKFIYKDTDNETYTLDSLTWETMANTDGEYHSVCRIKGRVANTSTFGFYIGLRSYRPNPGTFDEIDRIYLRADKGALVFGDPRSETFEANGKPYIKQL